MHPIVTAVIMGGMVLAEYLCYGHLCPWPAALAVGYIIADVGYWRGQR